MCSVRTMYRILKADDASRERRDQLRHPVYSKPELLATLGVTKSHSRPHVSNDNPFSESQFKTMKYRPDFPRRFDSHEHALGFCRDFFHWYNDEHYHTGIGLMTPAVLHYGEAEKVQRARQHVLQGAFTAHPDRFVNGQPVSPCPPAEVRINPPVAAPAHQKGLPEPHCPRKPEAPLTHPRPDYPSPSCVPAEHDSVSPSIHHDTDSTPFEHPSHASENPGGPGAGPRQHSDRFTNFDR